MAYLKAVRYVTNFRTLRHLICSLQLEYFSHQSSLAVWNVNPSLFHYMQKMIWCLEKAYLLHLKTLIRFFSAKSSIPKLFFTTRCGRIYQFFDQRNIYQDFCNHTGLFKFSTVQTYYLEWPVLTNIVHRDRQLVYVMYVRTPNFGHAYVEMYAHFPNDFSMIFILFKNLLL